VHNNPRWVKVRKKITYKIKRTQTVCKTRKERTRRIVTGTGESMYMNLSYDGTPNHEVDRAIAMQSGSREREEKS
jgi:hypothetical protein